MRQLADRNSVPLDDPFSQEATSIGEPHVAVLSLGPSWHHGMYEVDVALNSLATRRRRKQHTQVGMGSTDPLNERPEGI